MIYNIEQTDSRDNSSDNTPPTSYVRKQKSYIDKKCKYNIASLLLLVAACLVGSTNFIVGHGAHYAHYHSLANSTNHQQRLSSMFDSQGPTMQQAYLTSLLTKSQPYPPNKVFQFRPGSLLLSPAQSFRHCHVNMTTYGAHILHPGSQSLLAAVSDEYSLIYRNIPKSSSSTGRHVIQDFFRGQDRRIKHDELRHLTNNKGYELISFIREPLNRFYSSYDEAYYRLGPWMGDGEIVEDKPKMKKWYHKAKHKMDKYPYLYEGMTTITDFRKLYCPEYVLERGHGFKKCNTVPSIDDGTLTKRFEQFVRDYDGLDPFDVHLHLQVSNLVYGPTGEPLPVTALYNASNAEREWQNVAKSRGVTIPDGDITHGRKISRRFNVDLVTNGTKRKICRLLALDYCCLNMKLPKVCENGSNGAKEDDGDDNVDGAGQRVAG